MKIFLIILQVISSIGIISTVLLQSGKSAGMSGAIAGGAESFFGKKKGLDNMLGKLSTIFAISFMILTLLVALL